LTVSTGLSRFLPKATTIGLGLIVALLVVNTLISQWNTSRLLRNEHRVVHTQKALTTLEEVLARVTEAETAERGYLITDAPAYLQPYESAVARTWETLDHLSQLTADDAGQRARIAALRERVGDRFDELRRAIAARQSSGFDAARQSVSTNHGRQLMNDMRRLVGQMQRQEQEALAVRASESRHSARMTTVTDLVGTVSGISLVALAFYLFRRYLAHRQRAEDAIRRLAAIVQSSEDAIVSKSLDGVIVSWNSAAERLYGYSAEEAIGQSVTMLCPPERIDEVWQHLIVVRQDKHLEHFETTRVRKDRCRIDVSLSISPIKDAAGMVVGASAIARDVTEHKTLQREVLEIAAREQRRIGQDLHDGTGQELTGLAMMAQRLFGLLNQQSLSEARTAAKIVDGLEQALRNVRSLSRGLVPVEVDAEGLMVALADLTARTAELHGVECIFQCEEPVSIADNQTATHLYRMTQEALTNALKHGHAGRIDVSLEASDDLMTLKVVDDGVGIGEAAEEMTGTGLRIMRYRAELIRAKLSIERRQPHGTQMTCTLPQRQATMHVALRG
jgi:PAS domain S-box-containing protein